MAEFLIKALNAAHPDPDKDRRGCYKAGDIVEIRPDGAEYGKEECLPNFLVVRIPGLSVDAAYQYAMPDYVLGNPEFGIYKRRKHRFPFWNKLTQKDMDDIKTSNWLIKHFSETDIEVK